MRVRVGEKSIGTSRKRSVCEEQGAAHPKKDAKKYIIPICLLLITPYLEATPNDDPVWPKE